MSSIAAILIMFSSTGLAAPEPSSGADKQLPATPVIVQPAFVLSDPGTAAPDLLPMKGVANRSGAPLRGPKGPHLRTAPAASPPLRLDADTALEWRTSAPAVQPAAAEKWRAFDDLHRADFYKAHR